MLQPDIAIMEFGTGYTTRWDPHRIDTINRIYYIHGGQACYTVCGVTKPFQQGHLYFLPWYVDYVLTQSESDPLRHTFVHYTSNISLEVSDILDLKEADSSCFPVIAETLVSLVSLLATESWPGLAGGVRIQQPLPCDTLFRGLCQQIQELIRDSYHIRQIEVQDIIRVLLYMQIHHREKISVAQLSGLACLNEKYFIRKFCTVMKVTPYQFLQKLRYSIALDKISEGFSVEKAANFAGFSSSAAFYQTAKKYKADR